jgi:REP element-mobilizing transposase RayT
MRDNLKKYLGKRGVLVGNIKEFRSIKSRVAVCLTNVTFKVESSEINIDHVHVILPIRSCENLYKICEVSYDVVVVPYVKGYFGNRKNIEKRLQLDFAFELVKGEGCEIQLM